MVPSLDISNDVEVTSMESTNLTCLPISYEPQDNYGHISGLVNGAFTVCGGYVDIGDYWSQDCYKYEDYSFKKLSSEFSLNQGVSFAAYAQWQGQDQRILLAGGWKDSHVETDLIQIVGEPGTWTMPKTLTQSCMVHLFDDTYMLIGGITSNQRSNMTFLFRPITNGNNLELDWTEGPRLKNARNQNMCAILERNSRRYIVTVGGYVDTCEYLELFANNTWSSNWENCAPIPFPLARGEMITDPESGDLLLLGGYDQNESKFQDTIYRLVDVQRNWQLQLQHLTEARADHVSMFLPDSLLPCSMNTKIERIEL